ncbi:unnamed protein product, partial [marine sediment metagenome]
FSDSLTGDHLIFCRQASYQIPDNGDKRDKKPLGGGSCKFPAMPG